jgi:hypothetical protein
MANTGEMTIRPASVGDVGAIVDLLFRQEFTRPLTADQLSLLFTHSWGQKPDYGMVLTAGNRLVGVASTIYSRPRPLAGATFTTLNSGTLFVLPRYRARRTLHGVVRYSEELARAILRLGLPVSVFSAKGPNNVVPEILAGVGFQEVCAAEMFYMAGASARTALWPRGSVVSHRATLQTLLTPDQQTIVDDHEAHGCGFYAVEDRGRHALVVTKRRQYRGKWLWPWIGARRVQARAFPISDVLHLSDPGIAVESWGRLVARICRTEGTAGVTCSRSFFGRTVPRGREIPQRIHAFGADRLPNRVDKLYSELVLLP